MCEDTHFATFYETSSKVFLLRCPSAREKHRAAAGVRLRSQHSTGCTFTPAAQVQWTLSGLVRHFRWCASASPSAAWDRTTDTQSQATRAHRHPAGSLLHLPGTWTAPVAFNAIPKTWTFFFFFNPSPSLCSSSSSRPSTPPPPPPPLLL